MTRPLEENPRWHIKSYFAAEVALAVEQAGRELGPEALLVNSRPAPPEARHLGQYEVVFALDRNADGPRPPEAPQPAPPRQHVPPPVSTQPEILELQRQLDELRACLRPETAGAPHSSAEVYPRLLERGIDAELSGVVVRALCAHAGAELSQARPLRHGPVPVPGTPPACDAARLWELLPAELEKRFSVAPGLPAANDPARAVALVGPPGAGKTTTLVKLAVTYSVQARRPVQLISMDTLRIAAADQLRACAAALGVGFQALETPWALNQALNEARHAGLILIDTAGYSAANMADAAGLARCLAGRADIDTHLVVSAAMKPRDLNRVLERFGIFRPAKLIFTKLDETDSFGSIFCASMRTGLPVSFLAAGQSVPEDLEPASKEKIIELILADPERRAESAA